MGKNKSKRKPQTAYAKWTSIMRKLDNELEKEQIERSKNRDKAVKTA